MILKLVWKFSNQNHKFRSVSTQHFLIADELKEQLEDVNQDIRALDDQVRMCRNLSWSLFVCLTSQLKKKENTHTSLERLEGHRNPEFICYGYPRKKSGHILTTSNFKQETFIVVRVLSGCFNAMILVNLLKKKRLPSIVLSFLLGPLSSKLLGWRSHIVREGCVGTQYE